MKRKLIPVVSVVALALGALVAQGASAHQAAHHEGGGFGGVFAQTVVKGTVQSVNASAGTFTATVDIVRNFPGRGEGFGVGGGRFFHGAGNDGNSQGWGPGFRGSDGFRGGFGGRGDRRRSDQMSMSSTATITTNSSTKFDVNGSTSATIANLAPGDRFIATFAPSLTPPSTTTTTTPMTTPMTTTTTTPTSTMTTPTASGDGGWSHRGHHEGFFGMASVPTTPALEVIAEAPPQLYAFVGTVATAPTALPGSLAVSVTQSLPAGLFSGTQTFMIGSQTLVFGGSLSSLFGMTPAIASGDVVAGGEINMSGLTAAQVEANPLQILVDFTSTTAAPTPTTTTTTPTTTPSTTMPTTPAATAMTKRLRTASFNRALKRLMKHHRAAKRTHHAKHHAKAHRAHHARHHG